MITTHFRRVTIIRIKRPEKKDVNEELQWFSKSLGLFGPRDKEKSLFRVFLELLKASKRKKGLTSDDIALKANLSRGTVIHHLNTLAEEGLIQQQGNKYMLRVHNLEALVEEIHKEIGTVFEELKEAAEELDEALF